MTAIETDEGKREMNAHPSIRTLIKGMKRQLDRNSELIQRADKVIKQVWLGSYPYRDGPTDG